MEFVSKRHCKGKAARQLHFLHKTIIRKLKPKEKSLNSSFFFEKVIQIFKIQILNKKNKYISITSLFSYFRH